MKHSFHHIKKNIESEFSPTKADINDLIDIRKKYSGIPEEYLSFLEDVGFGDLGPIQLYSSPIPSADVYGEESGSDLKKIILFGDDHQGYCFGFDPKNSFMVVEISPTGEIDATIENSFVALLEGYFQ